MTKNTILDIFNFNKNKMETLQTLEQLRVLLKAKQFVLTGSFVTHKLGLCNNYSDIDIILVSPEPETLTLLKELEEKFPKNSNIVCCYDNANLYKFKYNDLKIDVFTTNNKYDEQLKYAGFVISPLNEIIKAKKSYNSPKQIFQLIKWRNSIISDAEINAFINK